MPMQQSFPIFLVDDDYKNFKPGKTRLKLKTVYKAYGISPEGILVLFGSIFLIFAAICVGFQQRFDFEQALNRSGKIVTGTVFSCQKERATKNHPEQIAVEFIYLTATATYHNIQKIQDDLDCTHFSVNSSIQIMYAEENPGISEIVRGISRRMNPNEYQKRITPLRIVLQALVMFWLFVVIVPISFGWVTWKRFGKHAVVLDGYVTSATNKSVKNGIERTIQFCFTPHKHKEQTGVHRLIHTSFPEPVLPLPDTLVKVLYVNKSTYLLL